MRKKRGKKSKMRIFISIEISKEAKKEIKKIQDQLPEFFGKKTESKNLHLTLKFLGDLDDDKIEKVRGKLRQIKFNSFKSEIDSIGVFSERFIRIIWLHLKNCDKLQKEVDNSLFELFDKEKRFMGHLTIARVKKIENKKKFLDNLNKIKIPKIKFKIDSFYLMKSELLKKGPKYFTIEKYNLKYK